MLSFSLIFGKPNTFCPPLVLLQITTIICYSLHHRTNRLLNHRRSTDLLAFLIIIWVGRKATGFRGSSIPSILDRIVKDATLYFLVIFTSHLIVEGFLIFAPVSPSTDSNRAHGSVLFFSCIVGWTKFVDLRRNFWYRKIIISSLQSRYPLVCSLSRASLYNRLTALAFRTTPLNAAPTPFSFP